MKETIENLRKIAKHTPISISWYNERLEKVKIIDPEGNEWVRQLNQNTQISVTEQVKAMVQVYKKNHKKRLKERTALN